MEMKEKRNETAGIGYSVIINLDKIAQRCFNFFFWGGGGSEMINNTHLHLSRNKKRNR